MAFYNKTVPVCSCSQELCPRRALSQFLEEVSYHWGERGKLAPTLPGSTNLKDQEWPINTEEELKVQMSGIEYFYGGKFNLNDLVNNN